MPEETKEEKEAREAKEAEEAKKKADEEAARKAKADADGDKTPPEKDLGEDLAGKDVSKFTPTEMIEYIDRLKDENAKRRIANRSLKDAQDKLEKRLSDLNTQLTGASKKLDEAEKEKKASADKEKSEVERLKSQVEDFQTKLTEMEGRVKESDKTLRAKDLQIKKQSREAEVSTLLQAANVPFSSDYERQGFMADLLKVDEDGDFKVNDEEVHYKVGQFVKKAKEKEKETPPKVPDTPPAGPNTRTGEPGLNERLKALTAKAQKGQLNVDDKKELDELLELASRAAAWDPRQSGGG